MTNILKRILQPIEHTQKIRGIELPDGIEFLQLIVTGPPGAGKTYYINQIRGWPNEGFIDLTAHNWWKNQSLMYRPREVHLGLPFKDFAEALTVFDKEWLEADKPLTLEPQRIAIPPASDSLFTTDWKHKYIFEFIITDPKTVFQRRMARHKEGYFPVDDHLSLDIVKEQANIYRQVALYLHRAQMQLYVREDIHAPPMRIVETEDAALPSWLLPKYRRTGQIVAQSGWKNFFLKQKAVNWLSVSEELQNITTPCRIAHDGKSFELRLEDHPLLFHPELPLGVKKRDIKKNWLIFSPLSCSVKNIVGFARLRDGQSITLGRDSALYTDLFNLGPNIARRHLQVTNNNGDLVLTPMEPDKEVSIIRRIDRDNRERVEAHRYDALLSLREIYGGPITMLPQEEATNLLKDVTNITAGDRFCIKNSHGRAGGIVDLPDTLTPVIVGDLHAQIDNLLKILSENYLLECLYANTACLILLGDAVHSEIAGEMEDMDSSITIMDLILKLKFFFPDNIFYLRGNHDSFDQEVSKNGISQGALMQKKLLEKRGRAYVEAMENFYATLPYIARSTSFCACHAAPPMSRVSLQQLINIHDSPVLINEVTTKRVQRPHSLNGYNKKDVKRLRKSLGLAKKTPFIVGHTPMDPFGSHWQNVNNIEGHHIIYSGHQKGAAALLIDGNQIIPLEFAAEPVTKLIENIP